MPAEPQDRSIECLNKIYQGAQMGCESISLLTEKVYPALNKEDSVVAVAW